MFVMAAVVMAGAVAIDDCAAQILLHQLGDGQLGCAAVNTYAELVEQLYCSSTQTSADDVGATVGSDESRQDTMLVFGSFEYLGRSDLASNDSDDS